MRDSKHKFFIFSKVVDKVVLNIITKNTLDHTKDIKEVEIDFEEPPCHQNIKVFEFSKKCEILDEHLLTGEIEFNCCFNIRLLTMSKSNDFFEKDNLITGFLSTQSKNKLLNTRISDYGIQTANIRIDEKSEIYILDIYSNINHFSRIEYNLNVVEKANSSIYLKYTSIFIFLKEKETYFLNKPIYVLVDARNLHRNEYDLEIFVKGTTKDAFIPNISYKDYPGTYIFCFYPLIPGKYLK